MVLLAQGNIFSASSQVITNPVNCVGVMGAGLAKQFAKRFPEILLPYKEMCAQGTLGPGRLQLWRPVSVKPILLFPTKRHWQDNSREEDIMSGLEDLEQHYQEWGVNSVALPALGCGLGGLEFARVRELVEDIFTDSALAVTLYQN